MNLQERASLVLSFLIILALAGFAHSAPEEFYGRVSYFGNGLIGFEFTFDPATKATNVTHQISTVSCAGAECTQWHTLGGSLRPLPAGGGVLDVAFLSTFQSPIRNKVSCTSIMETPGGLVVQKRQATVVPAPMRFANFPAFDLYDMPNTLIDGMKFIGRLPVQTDVAARAARFNATTCKLSGPTKDYVRLIDANLNTMIRVAGDVGGVVTKKFDEDLFELILYGGLTGNEIHHLNNMFAPRNSWVASASLSGGESDLPSWIAHNRVAAADIRLFVYRVLRQSGNTFSSAIFVQPLQKQGETYVAMGKPKIAVPFAATLQPNAERFSSISVEPKGRFFLFTSYSPTCGRTIVKLQKLNPNTGSKIGPPQVLLDCSAFTNSIVGAHGVDLLSTGD